MRYFGYITKGWLTFKVELLPSRAHVYLWIGVTLGYDKGGFRLLLPQGIGEAAEHKPHLTPSAKLVL